MERDPGKCLQIWEYPMSQRDEILRAYLKWGPYQMRLENYPYSKEKHPRRFQSSWLKMFPSWLEYSSTNDEAYCLACYLFSLKPDGRLGLDVFTKQGFRSWRKVNVGKRCAFLASYNDKLAQVVLENAPYNAKYTSHHIQKEILHIFSKKVRSHIREEIGDSKFCIIIDEAHDESKKEQMAIVLRFVDKDGNIKE